jgi:hypothetical protein
MIYQEMIAGSALGCGFAAIGFAVGWKLTGNPITACQIISIPNMTQNLAFWRD